ncbi:MAG: ferrous iron transport protein B [Bacteroidales bacterium]|nr:ferrous iron transport protein B [Bacteroidales bacterium]
MRLSELKNNESGIITKVLGRGAFRRRITEMGFIRGKKITVIKNAPLNDPIEYKLIGYNISLRRSEASLIEVVTKEDAKAGHEEKFNGTITEQALKVSAREKGKIINIALVGNPNAGKTTIFNYASKSRERVGNYSGVTVSSKTAVFVQDGYTFHITDLPGTYSLSAFSPEEIAVRDYIVNNTPDVVINIVDASNLERNLYLTTQLIDLDIKMIIALNMYDDLQKHQDMFDYRALGKMIGIPLVPTVGVTGKGIAELFREIIRVYNDDEPMLRHIHINYGPEVEKSIARVQEKIKVKENYNLTDRISSRFLAIKLLEKDRHIIEFIKQAVNAVEIKAVADKEFKRLEAEYHSDSETIISDAKYGFISGALLETFKPGLIERNEITRSIDNILTNKYFGFPVFFLFMYIMFTSTFRLGEYPMKWIDAGVAILGRWMDQLMAPGPLKELIIDGIINGVGGVIVFLPNIIILFLFISLMEDTGYMARAAFIMDKLMHRIGLHGKSFIPLLMGFGCNVPAIMATRTIENRNNRLLTMLIAPFMSCSARLPVYILLIGTFFPDYHGTILFGLYLTGIAIAVFSSLLLKKIFFKTDEVPFVMELPPYRVPTFAATIRHMWFKASQYLQKMGGVILVASIIIWALGYFPRHVDFSTDYDSQIADNTRKLEYLQSENSVNKNEKIAGVEAKIDELTMLKKAEHQEKSYLGMIGKFIEPAMAPLGFDWKISISLLTGIAAKEIVVSSMGVIYHVDITKAGSNETLSDFLLEAEYKDGRRNGQKVFSPLVAMSLLMFILIYFPCVAVIAAIRKESGSWKWAMFTVFYTTGLAWVVSFFVYQTGSLLGTFF